MPRNSRKRHKIGLLLAGLSLILLAGAANALPSFSRQTGEACTACHVQTWGANLTPRGREFKLQGYSEGEGSWKPPLSVVAEGGGFLNLDDKNSQRNVFGHPMPQPKDRSYFTGSVFYAGKIAGPVGAYVEGSYAHDPESGEGTGFLNKVDLRLAHQVNLSGHQIDYGISVNNEPGVQDLWNTNAVWSPAAVTAINRGVPLADRLLSAQVVGASLYAMVNDLLYVEAGGYASLPRDALQGIGRYRDGIYMDIDGGAPYWRIALQHRWGGHYFSIGHFGLQANFVQPDLSGGLVGALLLNAASSSDLGLDATYQYLANPEHIFEFKGRYIRETRDDAEYTAYPASVRYWENTRESFNLNAAYTWSQTLGASVGYNRYIDAGYNYTTIVSGNNYSISPSFYDLEYLTTELSYTPFGKTNSPAAPWANLRLSLAYLSDVSKRSFSVPQDSLYLSGRLAF